MQPVANGCRVWAIRGLGSNTLRTTLFGVVRHGLSGRAAPQVSRSRYTDEESRITFYFGVGRLHVHRGTALLRRVLVRRGGGARSKVFPLGRGTCRKPDRIWLLRTSGSFGSRSRPVARHRALSNSGAPRLRESEGSVQHSFGLRGCSDIALVSRIVAGSVVLRSRRSVATAPLCG